MRKELSVIVPVLNEAENIRYLLESLLKNIALKDYEVLIAYDNDDDNTIQAVEQIRQNYRFTIRLVKNFCGKGVADAIKSGIKSSDGEVIVVIMADLADEHKCINEMYELIKHKNYDLVCGSRYIPGGKQTGGPVLKGLMTRIASLSLHFLTRIPIHDVTNSFKMYRKSLFDRINIESSGGFELGMEITVKAFASGYRITEIPTVWTDRVRGESKFQMVKWLPRYLKWYFYGLRNCI
ncbi:MAG: glycosyltransferase [Planctomycetes bacterium]|nr:glycosyltransferase [Planctomycetota bacterium]